MKHIISVVLISILSASSLAVAGDLYHSKSNGPMGCNDRKITVEINYAADHPGTLDDNHFFNLATKGQCGPLSEDVALELIGFESLATTTGAKKLAYVHISKSNSSMDYFWMMQSDIVKIATRKPKPEVIVVKTLPRG